MGGRLGGSVGVGLVAGSSVGGGGSVGGGDSVGAGLVAGRLVGGRWVGDGMVIGGFVGMDGAVGVRETCSLGRLVAVGGMRVGDGDVVGVEDCVTVGEALGVKTKVADGLAVGDCVAVLEGVTEASTVAVGVTEPCPLFGIIRSGSRDPSFLEPNMRYGRPNATAQMARMAKYIKVALVLFTAVFPFSINKNFSRASAQDLVCPLTKMIACHSFAPGHPLRQL